MGLRAHLFGASSGGALALLAAAAGVNVERIAVHEVPYQLDEMLTTWRVYTDDLADALDADDRDQALRLFMRLAGSAEPDIAAAEAAPVWPAYELSRRPCATTPPASATAHHPPTGSRP